MTKLIDFTTLYVTKSHILFVILTWISIGFLKAQETPAKTPLRIDAVKDTTKQKDKITATVVLDTIVKDSLSKDSTAAKKGKSSLLDKFVTKQLITQNKPKKKRDFTVQ